MPVLDGYAATEQIRAGIVPGARFVPIVAYTSESAYMASVKTQKVGMNGFVGKPCSQIELIEALQQALEQTTQQASADAAADVLTGKTVLIADDSELNRKMVRSYVEPWGMKAVEACHGMEVLELLIDQGVKVDIVLMDMQMPGLSGIDTTQAIREQPRYQKLPIMALTGNFSEQSAQQAHAAGMNDFISKPFEADVLRDKLSLQLAAVASVVGAGHARDPLPTNEPDYGESRARPAPTKMQSLPAQAEPEPPSASVFARKAARPYPELKEINVADLPLLNLKHLNEFKARAPGFVVETWPEYLEDFATSQEHLRVALEQKNHEDLHRTLHSLMGNSGNAGAFAMHQFLKCRVAPDVETGHWPREKEWLETLADLCQRTEVEMRQYLAQITVPPAST